MNEPCEEMRVFEVKDSQAENKLRQEDSDDLVFDDRSGGREMARTLVGNRRRQRQNLEEVSAQQADVLPEERLRSGQVGVRIRLGLSLVVPEKLFEEEPLEAEQEVKVRRNPAAQTAFVDGPEVVEQRDRLRSGISKQLLDQLQEGNRRNGLPAFPGGQLLRSLRFGLQLGGLRHQDSLVTVDGLVLEYFYNNF